MGANVPWAQEAMATLHVVINEIKLALGKTRIKMLDIPCGDLGWMSRFLKSRDDVEYTGMDIVPDIIKNHQKLYKSYPWKFVEGDILTIETLQSYDLIFSRTLLQHLFFKDIFELLTKFSDSDSAYLLTTTWARHKVNSELKLSDDNPGRFRELNLEVSPFYLSPPMCLQRDGPPDAYQGWDHFLGLWKLPLKQVKGCKEPFAFDLPGTDKKVYSCINWSIKKKK